MQSTRTTAVVVSLMLLTLNSAAFSAADKKDKKDASPKDVLVGFMAALIRGDAEGLRAHAHVEGEEAKTVMGWLDEITKAGAEVRKASVARFGEEGAKKIDALQPFEANELRDFVEKIEGDTAAVHMGDPDGNAPIALKKVDGVWKLNMAELIKQEEWSAANIAKLSTGATKHLKELKERVAKGEAKSAVAVATEMRKAAMGEKAENENQDGL